MKFAEPPRPAKPTDATYRVPSLGKIGWFTVLYTNAGVTLLMSYDVSCSSPA